MTGDAVSFVTDALRAHRVKFEFHTLSPYAWFCKGCDWRGETEAEADAHVAAAVVAALGGLTHEVSQSTRICSYPGGPCVGKHHGRWVSGWLPEDAQ